MINSKTIIGSLKILFGVVMLYLIFHRPAPTFAQYPGFFVPAYYVILSLVWAIVILGGLRQIARAVGNKV